MPASSSYEQFRQLIAALTSQLDEMAMQSEETAYWVKYLQRSVQDAFANRMILGSADQIAIAIGNIGRAAGLSSGQIDILRSKFYSIVEASKAGANAFKFPGGLPEWNANNPGRNVPGGGPLELDSLEKIKSDLEERKRLLDEISRLKIEENAKLQAQTQVQEQSIQLQPREPTRYTDYSPDELRTMFSAKFGEEVVSNMERELNRLGSSIGQLQHVQQEAGGSLLRWTADMEIIPGVVESVNVVQKKNGEIIQDLQRRYKGFFSAIGRDLGEFLKWSIAASLIYVPLRKMNELMQESILLQVKLADVQIALGASTSTLNKVFESSATIAREMGVPLAGVIDGYVLAIRAAGDAKTEVERLALAEALLKDSMILAKLSGMDQAKALDTLVGALRQANLPLDQGTKLLDKWVAITKVANVDLATLSSSFAITATAAENAGVDIDKLNGIIAAVAEATILSGEETGNAVRGFIAGFQTTQAEKTLQKYGFAIRTTAGELRSFSDLIDDITQKVSGGLITDKQLTEIANAIGGGYRRGAQVATFLRNYQRALGLSEVSANASGDAAEALGIKLETLQTAATNLTNAFSELSRAFGQEGGLLENGTATLDFLAKLVDGLTAMVKTLGDATPKLIALAAAFLILRNNIGFQGLLQKTPGQAISGLGGILGIGGSGGGKAPTPGSLGALYRAGGGIAGGALTGALFASGDIAGGNYGKAGATIGAAAIGQMITGGSPIGGIIGATAVSAFYTGFIDRKPDLVQAYVDAMSEAQNIVVPKLPGEVKSIDDRFFEAFGRNLGAGFGKYITGASGANRAGGALQLFPTDEMVQTEMKRIIAAINSNDYTGLTLQEKLLILGLSPEQRQQIIDLGKEAAELAQQTIDDAAKEIAISPFTAAISANAAAYGPLATNAYNKELERNKVDFGKGLANANDYKDLKERGQGIVTVVSEIYTAMGAKGAMAATGMDTAAEAYEALSNIVISSSEEDRKALLAVISEYTTLIDTVSDERGGIGKARALQELRAQAIEIAKYMDSSAIYREYNIPSPIYINPDTTKEELKKIVDEVTRTSKELAEAMTQDPVEQQKILDSLITPYFQFGDALGEYIGSLGGKVNLEQLNAKLKEAGALAQGVLSIQQPDISTAQWKKQILPQLPAVVSWLQDTFGEKNITEERLGFIFNDKGTDIVNTNLLAVQLLLGELVDLNEKQLEGVFNLPEGMAAALPWTGKLFFSTSPVNQAGGGGFAFPYGKGESVPVEVTNLPFSNASWEDVIASRQAGNQAGFQEYPTGGAPWETEQKRVEAEAKALRERQYNEAGWRQNKDTGEWSPPSIDDIVKTLSPEIYAGQRQMEADAKALREQQYNDAGWNQNKDTGEWTPPPLMYATPPTDEKNRMKDYTKETPLESIEGLLENLFKNLFTGLESMTGTMTGTGLSSPVPGLGMGVGIGTGAIGSFDGVMGALSAAVEKLLPSQIPISTSTTIDTTNIIYIDGSQLQKAANKQMFKDFKLAKRRTGTLGFVTE